MEGDEFISTHKNNYNSLAQENENNFFLKSEQQFSYTPAQTEPIRHLNDYDANILQDGAYRDIQDNLIKLEYKISKTEEDIKNLEKQIQTANDMYDYYIADKLNLRKELLEADLSKMVENYKELSISARISGKLTSGVIKNFKTLKEKINKFFNTIIPKLPQKLYSFLEIRHSLTKLENINKSVNELMKMQYPYGEAVDKYNQLSKYIVRANSIQAEISKIVK